MEFNSRHNIDGPEGFRDMPWLYQVAEPNSIIRDHDSLYRIEDFHSSRESCFRLIPQTSYRPRSRYEYDGLNPIQFFTGQERGIRLRQGSREGIGLADLTDADARSFLALPDKVHLRLQVSVHT